MGVRKYSDAAGKKLTAEIYRRLFEVYGQCRCSLHYSTPHELLVATVLSAQCMDKRVNLVTPELFRRYPDVAAFAAARQEEVENIIRPVGFFRHKAESIIKASRGIMERFGGEVPSNMDDLVTLSGIGRKTANVILGDAFEVPGFPVDTHVNRVLNRIGIAGSALPEKIERRINAWLPPEQWANFSHMLILHGRETCMARKPACGRCPLVDVCVAGKQDKG